QDIRHGIDVLAVDADVEQRGVQSLALDRLERPLQGRNRTGDGPSGIAENGLDQSGDHRFVFDDQHPPGRVADATPSNARRSLPSGEPDVRVRLFWGTEGEGWHALPSTTPSTVCYCESSGILKLTRSPPSSNSIFAFPSRPWLTSRSIKVRPKPCRGGLPTDGPPRSTQSNTRLSRLRLSIAQETSSDPPAADRE